jgi:hypothetical protein
MFGSLVEELQYAQTFFTHYQNTVLIGKMADGELLALDQTATELGAQFQNEISFLNQTAYCTLLASLHDEVIEYFMEKGVNVGVVTIKI